MPPAARVTLDHVPGRHCASTALADLARFHGLPYSEAFCFGLGAGLGTFYAHAKGLSPSRMLHVRSGPFERAFFARLGVDPRFHHDPDPHTSERVLKERLAEGLPSLLRTDLRHLPYYGTNTSFPAHAILAVAYDDARATFTVFDTERPMPLEVPYQAMLAARHVTGHPLGHLGDAYCPSAMVEPPDLGERLVAAVVAQARELARTDDPHGGLTALDRLAGDLPHFRDDADWTWNARFAYQVVEKRGTGGGGFRTMYAEFLEEAGARVPRIAELGLAAAMRASAGAFSAFARSMREASEQSAPEFGEAIDCIRRVRGHEAEYASLALALA